MGLIPCPFITASAKSLKKAPRLAWVASCISSGLTAAAEQLHVSPSPPQNKKVEKCILRRFAGVFYKKQPVDVAYNETANRCDEVNAYEKYCLSQKVPIREPQPSKAEPLEAGVRVVRDYAVPSREEEVSLCDSGVPKQMQTLPSPSGLGDPKMAHMDDAVRCRKEGAFRSFSGVLEKESASAPSADTQGREVVHNGSIESIEDDDGSESCSDIPPLSLLWFGSVIKDTLVLGVLGDSTDKVDHAPPMTTTIFIRDPNQVMAYKASMREINTIPEETQKLDFNLTSTAPTLNTSRSANAQTIPPIFRESSQQLDGDNRGSSFTIRCSTPASTPAESFKQPPQKSNEKASGDAKGFIFGSSALQSTAFKFPIAKLATATNAKEICKTLRQSLKKSDQDNRRVTDERPGGFTFAANNFASNPESTIDDDGGSRAKKPKINEGHTDEKATGFKFNPKAASFTPKSTASEDDGSTPVEQSQINKGPAIEMTKDYSFNPRATPFTREAVVVEDDASSISKESKITEDHPSEYTTTTTTDHAVKAKEAAKLSDFDSALKQPTKQLDPNAASHSSKLEKPAWSIPAQNLDLEATSQEFKGEDQSPRLEPVGHAALPEVAAGPQVPKTAALEAPHLPQGPSVAEAPPDYNSIDKEPNADDATRNVSDKPSEEGGNLLVPDDELLDDPSNGAEEKKNTDQILNDNETTIQSQADEIKDQAATISNHKNTIDEQKATIDRLKEANRRLRRIPTVADFEILCRKNAAQAKTIRAQQSTIDSLEEDLSFYLETPEQEVQRENARLRDTSKKLGKLVSDLARKTEQLSFTVIDYGLPGIDPELDRELLERVLAVVSYTPVMSTAVVDEVKSDEKEVEGGAMGGGVGDISDGGPRPNSSETLAEESPLHTSITVMNDQSPLGVALGTQPLRGFGSIRLDDAAVAGIAQKARVLRVLDVQVVHTEEEQKEGTEEDGL